MSILKNLRTQKRISKDVEALIANLTVEELVYLKLEISAKAMNGEPYGFKIWFVLPDMIKTGLIDFTKQHFNTNSSASRFLGVDMKTWGFLKKRSSYKEQEL
jgi:hypothetical protein|tara:strand:+ start:299 stop:604 length:306 start_codon:yes stop_codon:yes gene_type:complete